MVGESAQRRRRRLLVIGVDAATMDLIRPWAASGQLPTFQRLFQEGSSGLLRSVPSRNSAAAWTSMVTGKNPGKHGIFFFTEYRPGSLDFSYVNGSHRVGPAIWNLLSEAGKRVGVINVPMTYPAEKVNGFMISGMDAPGVHDPRHIYPGELSKEIQGKVGQYVIETGLGSYMKAGKLDQGVRALHRTTDARLATARYLMTDKDWDFLTVVFRETDPAQHYFWKYMRPDGFQVACAEVERYGGVIPDVYKHIDVAVGELLELAGPDTVTIVVSDHGASADTAKAKVLYRWLEAMGVLQYQARAANGLGQGVRHLTWGLLAKAYRQLDKRFSREVKKRLFHMFPTLRSRTEGYMAYSRIDWAATKAFSDGKRAEIWINLKGRQPFGIVEPGQEYWDTCAFITEELYKAREARSGKPLVQKVYHRDEVYHGPYVDRATDLIIEWHKNALADAVDFGDGKLVTLDRERAENPLERLICGAHDPMGILFMCGGPVRRGLDLKEANIVDIAPTVLYLLGQPIPEDMDGRVLLDALEPDYVASHPVQRMEATVASHPVQRMEATVASAPTEGYTKEDEAIIEERLRGLGYIE